MHGLRKVPFLAFDNQPAQGKGTSIVDDADHEGDAATSDNTSINGKQERLVGEIDEERLSNGKKPCIECIGIVGDPAAKAHNEGFLVSATSRSVIGDAGEMGGLSGSEATDERSEGIEVAFAMTGKGRKELQKAAFYGSIPTIRVTHMFLRTERS